MLNSVTQLNTTNAAQKWDDPNLTPEVTYSLELQEKLQKKNFAAQILFFF